MEENSPFRTLWIARVESLSQLNQPSWEFKQQQQQAESPTAAVSHSGHREEKKCITKMLIATLRYTYIFWEWQNRNWGNLPFRTLWIARVESLSQLNQPSWEFKQQQQQAESPTAVTQAAERKKKCITKSRKGGLYWPWWPLEIPRKGMRLILRASLKRNMGTLCLSINGSNEDEGKEI